MIFPTHATCLLSSRSLPAGLLSLLLLFLSACSGVPQREDSEAKPPAMSGKPATHAQRQVRHIFLGDDETGGGEDENIVADEESGFFDGLFADETAQDDLWRQIAAGLQLLPEVPRHRYAGELKRYARHPQFFERLSRRAHPYLYHIVSEIKRRDMPLELALLPAIESAYRPELYSPAKAAGLWQFMPATGKHFGLKRSYWYDGRRDIIASTDAALDYLQMLYQQFDKNWLHALAAYNCGEGTMRKALRNHDGEATFWNLDLPAETRRYVPRLLAFSEVIANPERYAIQLRRIANTPYLQSADTDGQIDLHLAARLADVSLAELRELNPGFLRGVTDPDGPHTLLLPIGKVKTFSQALAAIPREQRIPRQIAQQALRKNQPERHSYRVREGDSLWLIARRFNTSVSTLCALNRIDRQAQLRPGQLLRIPLDEQTASRRVARKLMENAPTALTQREYKVRAGDNLGKIAQRYHTSVAKLCKLNGLQPTSLLKIGMLLRLPDGR